MSSLAATPPSVSWAQTKCLVFLTFNVECDNPEINIDELNISFKGLCGPDRKLHAVDIPLYAGIDPEKSQQNNKGRVIELVLVKAEPENPFWEALTRDKKKYHWLKVDFNRWEDEEDSANEIDDMNDMFQNSMGDFGDGEGLDDSYDDKDDDESSGEEYNVPGDADDDVGIKKVDGIEGNVLVKENEKELKEECGDSK